MTPAALCIGIGNLVVGAAYSALGLLSAWEAISQYRHRGLSRFGLGFTLMAVSCGPHHLVHGWCVLQGGGVSTPMWVVAVLGLPAGAVFCWLRAEAMLGGRGDRTLVMSARAPVFIAGAFAITAGAMAALAIAAPPLPGSPLCSILGIEWPPGGWVSISLPPCPSPISARLRPMAWWAGTSSSRRCSAT